MRKSRVLAPVIALAVFFTVIGISVAKDTPQTSKSNNAAKIQKLMGKDKGAKGEDYSSGKTAGVGAVGEGGIKAEDSQELKDKNKEIKDNLYKESEEVKK